MILVRPVVPSSIEVANRRTSSVWMKSWSLLSVRDAGERRVLPAEEDAGVTHDGDQETCLTVRETERRERSLAFSGKTIHIWLVWFHVGCSDHLKACCSYKRCEVHDS
jgi:hypothetical protein